MNQNDLNDKCRLEVILGIMILGFPGGQFVQIEITVFKVRIIKLLAILGQKVNGFPGCKFEQFGISVVNDRN